MDNRQVRNTIIRHIEDYILYQYSQHLQVDESGDNFRLTLNGGHVFGNDEFYQNVIRVLLPDRFSQVYELSEAVGRGEYASFLTRNSIIISKAKMAEVFENLHWAIESADVPENCQDCNVEFDSDNVIVEVGRLHFICQTCQDENYQACNGCDSITDNRENNMTETESGDYFCTNCSESGDYCYHCEDCSTWYSGDERNYIEDYGDVCQSCYEDNYGYCNTCEDNYSADDINYCEPCGESFCGSCWDNHDCSDENDEDTNRPTFQLTPNYSKLETEKNKVFNLPKPKKYTGGYPTSTTEPELKFFKGKDDKFLGINKFVGVEIEVEVGKFKASIKKEMPASTTIKTDGTISGFELNTPPASGDKLVKIIKKSCSVLRKHGYQGTRKCGLHIHIDCRDIENNPTKIINLVRTYFAIEDIIFSMIPQSRWNSNWCKNINPTYIFKGSEIKNNGDVEKMWYGEKCSIDTLQQIRNQQGGNDRYHGLNISAIFSQHTLEVRYHSGTTSSEKILNWIALNLRLFDYATEHYNQKEMKELFDMETSQEKFIKFCEVFKIPEKLKRYIQKRASLFNPDWETKFNKGKVARDVEEYDIVYYKKLMQKEAKSIMQAEYKKLRAEFAQKHGKGWTKKFNITTTKKRAKEIADMLVSKYFTGRINTGGRTYGLIHFDEIQKKKEQLQRGMLMVINKSDGHKEDDEFEYEMEGLLA